MLKAVERMKEFETPDLLQEKEYHFDEGVGVSLDQHVTQLKKTYPNARI